MTRLKSKLLGAALGAATLASLGVVHATGTAVAKVGSYEIDQAEVQKRLAQMPLFQLKNMGETPDDVRKNFVDQLVELEVFVQGARAQKFDELPEVSSRIRSALVSALLDDLAQEAANDGAVSDEKVRAYYDAHKDRYLPQKRIMIWQIAVKTKVEADKLLKQIQTGAEFKNEASFVNAWDKLAREHSIDKSTHMRKGNLGFVQPDGSTHHKDVRVPKAMYDAAAGIKDGEVYAKALQVESFWVVLARRGSTTTPHRTFEQERETIRGFLAREHVTKKRTDLIDQLREQHMREKNERLLEQVTIKDNAITVSRRPGALREARAPRGLVKPVGKPGNLR